MGSGQGWGFLEVGVGVSCCGWCGVFGVHARVEVPVSGEGKTVVRVVGFSGRGKILTRVRIKGDR